MNQPLTIWCNAHLPSDLEQLLQRETADHHLLLAQQRQHNLTVGGRDPQLKEADVAFGQPTVPDVLDSPRLKWVHITSAGYTRYDTDDFRQACRERGLILTNSSAVFDEPCAQHAAAFLYAHARQLLWTTREQLTTRSWHSGAIRESCLLLGGQRVLIYGYGAIARRLVELLAPLQLDIIGVRRKPSGDEAITTITPREADALLGEADVIVNLLPANDASERFFGAERLSRVKRGAIFMNIGRGTTIDQDALLRGLEADALGAAYLDVTDPEPLPPEHPLWRHPRCLITPHTAGGHDTEHRRLLQHFLDNLERYQRGQAMGNRVI